MAGVNSMPSSSPEAIAFSSAARRNHSWHSCSIMKVTAFYDPILYLRVTKVHVISQCHDHLIKSMS